MKRISLCALVCLLLLICLSGCSKAYTLSPVEQTGGSVDTQIIDRFLTNNKDYPNYEEICKNVPDILFHLIDVTPDGLQGKCAIYRFTYESGTSLAGNTFLVYDGDVYPLGTAFGGHGITEFAYSNANSADILYFIYSWGSGIHRSHIGSFDFETRQLADFGGLTFSHMDISFQLSKDGQTLGVCQAQISFPNDDLHPQIIKGDLLYEDITALEFVTINTIE